MSRVIEISLERIKPDPIGVLKSQGIPVNVTAPERVTALYESAEELFLKLVAPKGIMSEISIEEFTGVYSGNGMNEPETPLERIYPQSGRLALFAFTLGNEISREIETQNKKNLALAYMLDAIASYSAEKASEVAQTIFYDRSVLNGAVERTARVLLYSPGYCGWSISGQEKLFAYLKPREIGITLTESFLMIPLKSISGVLVAGNPGIHRFVNNYPFCVHCRALTCRSRIKDYL